MSGREWIEVIAKGPSRKKDEAALLLFRAGSPGVVEADPALPENRLVLFSSWEDETAEEPSGPVSVLKAYIAPDAGILKDISSDLKRLGWVAESREYTEEDWSTKWRAKSRPVRISKGSFSLLVRPTWATSKRPADIEVVVDPGMAFGTGGHETTRMCLKALVDLFKNGQRGLKGGLLDVGTGTGVIAIAAKKLGVGSVLGTDIDAVAVKVARKNARLNKVDIRLNTTPLERIKGEYPIVAANILSKELIRLCPFLIKRLCPGGFLILSGILKEEKQNVIRVFIEAGLKKHRIYGAGEWSAIVFKRPKG